MKYSTNTAPSSFDSLQTANLCPENTLLVPDYAGFKQLKLPEVVDNPRAHRNSAGHHALVITFLILSWSTKVILNLFCNVSVNHY